MKNQLPKDFYKKVYETVKKYDAEPNFEESSKDYVEDFFALDFEIDGVTYSADGSYTQIWKWCDESFDHAFGTYYDYDVKFAGIDDITIENAYIYDGNNDKYVPVEFDNSNFDEFCFEEDV